MVEHAVTWGILSTANINDKLLSGAAESDRVHVAAVASRDQGRADAYARERGIERGYGSYDALLADPEIEAVYISLPNGDHAPWSIRALEAGKHVLCEKPLSRRASDAEAAFDAADRAGRLLMEAFMYRHNPQTHALVKLIEDGVIGALQVLRAVFSFTMPDPEVNVRNQSALEGGGMMDVGCYCVNNTRLLAGEPERVYARQVTGPGGVDVRFSGLIAFPDDVVGLIEGGIDRLPPRDELEAVGTEGSLFLDDPWHCREPVIEHQRGGEVERIPFEPVSSYRLELENLSDAIRGRAEPLLGRADAVPQARVIEALYASAESGEPVTLRPTRPAAA